MRRLGLERHIVDRAVRDRTARRLAERGVRLPTFAEIVNPATQPQATRTALATVDPDTADPPTCSASTGSTSTIGGRPRPCRDTCCSTNR